VSLAWFRPPRQVLALFLLMTLVPSVLLIALGWHSLQQDRAREQNINRDQTADLIVANLQQRLSTVERQLQASSLAASKDSAVVVFEPKTIQGNLAFYPLTSAGEEARPPVFAAGNELQRRRHDYVRAAAFFHDLARSSDPAVRGGALILLATNLRLMGQADAALTVYRQAADVRGVAVPGIGVPVDLFARHAALDLLRGDALRRESDALSADLLDGRWRLARDVWEANLPGVPPTRSSAVALAEAASWLWRQWPTLQGSAGRQMIRIEDREITVVWTGGPNRIAALIAGPDFVRQNWIAPLSPMLLRQQATVSLFKTGVRAATAVESVRASPDLPWDVVVKSGPLPALSVVWIAGFGLLALAALLGTYFIARAVTRELAVARLQSDFVSAVSHEFRTPLTSLRQLTEILADGRLVSEDRRRLYYDALTRQTERLHQLVETLLDFGRMEAGSSPYRLEPLDPCALVRSVVQQFEHEAEGRGYHVELDINDTTATIAGDREALTNALWNLLDNAVKYSLECRTIWVRVERDAARLAIRVRDRGLGIPRDEHSDIFRKFVRGAGAKAHSIKGTGIGLAMVAHIVKAHRGEVRLQSEPGAGSTFTLLLPCHES
jgi:signal transduction histidine kinase